MTDIALKLISRVPNAPFLFPGELHFSPFHRFLGPGTHLAKRLEIDGSLSEPVSRADALAKQHDIDYSLAGRNNPDSIRAADIKFLQGIDALEDPAVDARVSRKVFQAKMAFEDKHPLIARAVLGDRFGRG